MHHLPSSSSHPETTFCSIQSIAAQRALGTRHSPQKRCSNWATVSGKPTYAGWATNSLRRAHVGIPTHNSRLCDRHAIVGDTTSTKTVQHVAHVVDCGPRPPQCNGHTMEAHFRGFPLNMSTGVRSGCLELPRQGRPLLLGEWSGSTQSDVQPIQGSLPRGDQSAPQILEAVLVQPACAAIPGVHAVALSPTRRKLVHYNRPLRLGHFNSC